jgi:hypothetical protein
MTAPEQIAQNQWTQRIDRARRCLDQRNAPHRERVHANATPAPSATALPIA